MGRGQWTRWGRGVCEGWSLEIGVAFHGSVVRRDRGGAPPIWIASINSSALGEILEREIAMRRVEELVSRASAWCCSVPKMMKWGLIPYSAKDDKLQYSTFNARAEEFPTKPAFRDAWKRDQRCLVVTDGFYEWKKLDAKGKLEQPHAIAMAERANGDGRSVGEMESAESR